MGSIVVAQGLSCPEDNELNVSSALGSEFLTTRPPGKSFNMIFNAHPGGSDCKASAYNAGDLS